MIVIPRKPGESLLIADDIIVTVIEVQGDKVRLGIEIPRGGTVRRREVYEAILSPKEDQATEPPYPLQPSGSR
jgi:carbon storage regulator